MFGFGSQTILDDISEDAIFIEYVPSFFIFPFVSYTDFVCRGYRSRLDEEVDNARPNDPVMLGAQFELDLSTEPFMYFPEEHYPAGGNVSAAGGGYASRSHQRISSVHSAGMGSGSDDQNSDHFVVGNESTATHNEVESEGDTADQSSHVSSGAGDATPPHQFYGSANNGSSSRSMSLNGKSNATGHATPASSTRPSIVQHSSRSANSDSSDENSETYDYFTPSFDTSQWVKLKFIFSLFV